MSAIAAVFVRKMFVKMGACSLYFCIPFYGKSRAEESMKDYTKRLQKAIDFFNQHKYVLVLAGAGLAYDAGLHAYGDLLYGEFADFADKFLLTDLNEGFTSIDKQCLPDFYSRYARVFHHSPPKSEMHEQLFNLLKHKKYFVTQLNPDYLFERAGFDPNRVFHTAGEPHLMQCAQGCCDTLLPVPNRGEPLPVCPWCGGEMRPYLDIYGDDKFVTPPMFTDKLAHHAAFVHKGRERGLLVLDLECGIHDHFGVNGSIISRNLMRDNRVRMIRINSFEPIYAECENLVSFDESAADVITELLLALPQPRRGRPPHYIAAGRGLTRGR